MEDLSKINALERLSFLTNEKLKFPQVLTAFIRVFRKYLALKTKKERKTHACILHFST